MATLTLFTKFPANAMGGEATGDPAPIDYLSDTIKASLHTSVASFAQDTDEFFSDVANEVAAGNGYTAGGNALTSKVINTDAATNKMMFDAADPAWTASGAGFAANSAIFYKDTGTPSTSYLIGWLDFGSTITLASGDSLTIQLDATNGLFYTTVT
jgi:hypothetical protein